MNKPTKTNLNIYNIGYTMAKSKFESTQSNDRVYDTWKLSSTAQSTTHTKKNYNQYKRIQIAHTCRTWYDTNEPKNEHMPLLERRHPIHHASESSDTYANRATRPSIRSNFIQIEIIKKGELCEKILGYVTDLLSGDSRLTKDS